MKKKDRFPVLITAWENNNNGYICSLDYNTKYSEVFKVNSKKELYEKAKELGVRIIFVDQLFYIFF